MPDNVYSLEAARRGVLTAIPSGARRPNVKPLGDDADWRLAVAEAGLMLAQGFIAAALDVVREEWESPEPPEAA